MKRLKAEYQRNQPENQGERDELEQRDEQRLPDILPEGNRRQKDAQREQHDGRRRIRQHFHRNDEQRGQTYLKICKNHAEQHRPQNRNFANFHEQDAIADISA